MAIPHSFEYLRPNRMSTLFCLTLLQSSLTSRSFSNVEAIVDIQTNLSVFHLPIYLYNGHLTVSESVERASEDRRFLSGWSADGS